MQASISLFEQDKAEAYVGERAFFVTTIHSTVSFPYSLAREIGKVIEAYDQSVAHDACEHVHVNYQEADPSVGLKVQAWCEDCDEDVTNWALAQRADHE
jgi:hypothetical protein